jgi:hypothetical protein
MAARMPISALSSCLDLASRTTWVMSGTDGPRRCKHLYLFDLVGREDTQRFGIYQLKPRRTKCPKDGTRPNSPSLRPHPRRRRLAARRYLMQEPFWHNADLVDCRAGYAAVDLLGHSVHSAIRRCYPRYLSALWRERPFVCGGVKEPGRSECGSDAHYKSDGPTDHFVSHFVWRSLKYLCRWFSSYISHRTRDLQ